MNLNRYLFMSVVCCLVAMGAACNYTEPGTCSLGQGGGGPTVGQGGGVVLPPQGGLGDDVDPQGAGDPSDPCNKTEPVPKVKRDLYCNGDVVCWDTNSPGAAGCHHENTHVKALDPDAAVDELVKECQDAYPDYDCEPEKLSCADLPKAGSKPVPIYVCNGAVSPCTDSNGLTEACNYVAREVYAWNEAEAREFLREECETVLAEQYGDTCEYGGFCCEVGSLTCNKKLTPPPSP